MLTRADQCCENYGLNPSPMQTACCPVLTNADTGAEQVLSQLFSSALFHLAEDSDLHAIIRMVLLLLETVLITRTLFTARHLTPGVWPSCSCPYSRAEKSDV